MSYKVVYAAIAVAFGAALTGMILNEGREWKIETNTTTNASKKTVWATLFHMKRWKDWNDVRGISFGLNYS